MTAMYLLFFFSAVVSFSASTDLFGLVGSSVQMNVQNKQDTFGTFTWVFNHSYNIVKYPFETKAKIFKKYERRVEFDAGTYTLILKDLQTNDTGLYEAKVDDEIVTTVITYNLHVFEAVKKPKLNITCEQNSDFFNVTCSSENISVAMSFSNATFNVKNETLLKDGDIVLFLNLYLNNGSIICNASNKVSSNYVSKNIKQVNEFCSPKVIIEKGIISTSKLMLILAVPLLIIIIITIICVLKNKRRGDQQTYGTVYEEVQNKQPKPAREFNQTTLELEPCTVYVTVGRPTNSASVSDLNKQDKTTLNSYYVEECTKPETVYATVSKNGKAPPLEDKVEES